MKRTSLAAVLGAVLCVGCASSRTYDRGKWDPEGMCAAVTESLTEGNYRIEMQEIRTPPVERAFRARLVGVRHETMSDTRCCVDVRPEEKLGRYRFDVYVDTQNPFLFGVRQRIEREEERFLDDLMERLAKATMRARLKPY